MFGIRVKTGHKNTAEDLRGRKQSFAWWPKLTFTRHTAQYVLKQVSEKGSANR